MKATSRKILRNVSLARALSKLGHCSRTEADSLIRNGDVAVNGAVVKVPSFRCSLSHDKITVKEKPLAPKTLLYIMMNKPVGVVTTKSDERGRETVYDVLGDIGKWVFPVGRLDKDTSGLLLFTNDHRLGERLTNPNSKVSKTYIVLLDRPMLQEHIAIFRHGMTLDEEQLMPAKVRQMKENVLGLTIYEGKNRQVRRMCQALGYTVVSLERVAIGNLKLDGLNPAQWRNLLPDEVLLLTNDR